MTTRSDLEAARDRLREQVSQWTDGAFFQITYRQPLVDLLALLDALLAQEPVAWRFPPDVSHEDDGWYIVDGANRPSGNRLWQPLYALHIVEDQ